MFSHLEALAAIHFELLDGAPELRNSANMTHDRALILLELMQTGCSLLEDRPDVAPPVMPQRFAEMPELVAVRVLDEFAKICRSAGAEKVALRVAHSTLCAACRLDRRLVTRYLLESGLCDPSCEFIHPIEARPLQLAAACGYGFIMQLLFDHKADPNELDRNGERPVDKLSRLHDEKVDSLRRQVHALESRLGNEEMCEMQSRILELEARLRQFQLPVS
eukprot:TRINITY_DN9136_c0_g1_i2.p1 TRINITY_DN9136_c0_g1~~TRINITY_DN9136_c0_g1_i2.p1  ORF type:complete len:220 (-),score=53.93 TRINITY_DN9136_c0_g1_i2:83-742(-)